MIKIRRSEKRISREEIKEILYRRRYVIPNAVTVGNMFCGFLAIMYASSGRFEKAVFAVLIAILLDGLDGRVARKLNATSKFGVEFDSLSDLVSFGVAPAVMMYHWAFHLLADELGVAITFFYLLCAASRLARFNVSTENLKNFSGLPTPGAAVFVVAVINTAPYAQSSYLMVGVGMATMLSIGYLMVSTIEFFSIKQFKMSGIKRIGRLLLGLLIALTWYDPVIGLLVIAAAYAASGPYMRIRSAHSI
ncbi:MAG: CDP-diacylglycerol--serine O-phosphatidyltransferase [Proteobacteria bacterium]|jgi:CDP-diacylglycerol---serine O-phosphatidyltransferase|nr:CDP-diacylglycerol--serine O-phosphatidyltransferase [Pseudomonadota bacterium]